MGIFGNIFGGNTELPYNVAQWAAGKLSSTEAKEFGYLFNRYDFGSQMIFRGDPTGTPMFEDQLSIFLNNVGFELRKHGKVDDATKAFMLSVTISENESGLMSLALIHAEQNQISAARGAAARYVALHDRERSRAKSEAEEFVDSINPFGGGDEDEEVYTLMKHIADGGDVSDIL